MNGTNQADIHVDCYLSCNLSVPEPPPSLKPLTQKKGCQQSSSYFGISGSNMVCPNDINSIHKISCKISFNLVK